MKNIILTVFIFTSISQVRAMIKLEPLDRCLSTKDSLDREFCYKKRSVIIEQNFTESYKKHESNFTQADKNNATSEIQSQIDIKKEIIRLTQEEIKIQELHVAKLNSLASNEEKAKAEQDQAQVKEDEKKEKIKKLFKRIF